MNKRLIRDQLQTIKNNYAIAQAGIALLVRPGARKEITQIFSIFSAHPEMHAIRYIDYIYMSDELLKLATNEFRKAVLRNCLKELFETTKLYGKQTHQEDVIRAAPWFQFLRMIRDSLSHDMKLRFSSIRPQAASRHLV